jgi:hypothetical protein
VLAEDGTGAEAEVDCSDVDMVFEGRQMALILLLEFGKQVVTVIVRLHL